MVMRNPLNPEYILPIAILLTLGCVSTAFSADNKSVETKPAKKEKKIAISEYMLPLKAEEPKINKWINVRMHKGKRMKSIMDVQTTSLGMYKVGEVLGESGYHIGIYEMDGHKLSGPVAC